MTRIDRARYGALYGPTVGDRLRLADTDLWLEVEEDRCVGGDEAVFGGGKTIRESMLQGSRRPPQGAPDVVITNVVVLDHWGVIRCDVGIRDGRIAALGKAGNPDIADGVHPDLEIGPSTDVIAGEGRILTAGGIDCHVHFICPQIVDQAVAAGMTTLIGGGTGPSEGTRATTCTPSPRALHEMLLALDTHARQRAAARQGQHRLLRGPDRAGARRRGRVQAPRGLGLDAGGDRRLPARRRRDGRAGRDPHRHAQRGRLPAVDPRRDRRPRDPRLPHRGRRRRPCAGHHRDRGAAQRPAVLDEPDAPAHVQHGRRAPRHAHRLPPPQPAHPGGPRVRGEADPGDHDRRRGRPARPRRDLDDRLGLAGDGPRRRDDHAHVADRARDEGAARRAAGAAPTTRGCAATSRSTRSARRSRTGSTSTSARSSPASSPTSCCGTRRSSRSGRGW